MDVKSISEREIAAFMAGAEAETLELRGYPLSETERAELLEEAAALYGGFATVAVAPLVAPVAA